MDLKWQKQQHVTIVLHRSERKGSKIVDKKRLDRKEGGKWHISSDHSFKQDDTAKAVQD